MHRNLRVIAIGEILFDHFPEYRRLGGAPFNFVYHLKQLDIPVRFITRVGNDSEGDEIINRLTGYRFNTDDIQIDAAHGTGRVTVNLDPKGIPVFDIESDAAYDYLTLPDTLLEPEMIDKNTLIYFGSLIQRTPRGFKAVQQFLSSRSIQRTCLYDMNLRPDGYNETVVFESLKQADLLKLNEEELDIVRRMTGSGLNRSDCVRYLMDQYRLEMVSLTKGDKGSELYVGDARYDAKTVKIDTVEDTVGAGDAYAAMLAIGYLNRWGPEKILSSATRFSGRLCTVQGAIPPSSFYDLLNGFLQGERQ